MIKRKHYFLLAAVLLVLFVFKYGLGIKVYINSFLDSIRNAYLNTTEYVTAKKDEHLFQQKTIKILKKEIERLEVSASLSSAFAGELNAFLGEHNGTCSPKMELVRAKSYVRLSDYNKVFLDFDDINQSKIYGLLSKGLSAGIVVGKEGKAVAHLQGDAKCIFSVYAGKDKIPGVIFGNKKNMIIRYIPPWMEPKISDEVFTSGLDNIFFEGVKVGKIIKIIDEESYKSALVQPYANIKIPGYFHIIKNASKECPDKNKKGNKCQKEKI